MIWGLIVLSSKYPLEVLKKEKRKKKQRRIITVLDPKKLLHNEYIMFYKRYSRGGGGGGLNIIHGRIQMKKGSLDSSRDWLRSS